MRALLETFRDTADMDRCNIGRKLWNVRCLKEFALGTLWSFGDSGEVETGVTGGEGKIRQNRGGPHLLARPTARAVPMKTGTTDLHKVTGKKKF